jgi:hypothetical protein
LSKLCGCLAWMCISFGGHCWWVVISNPFPNTDESRISTHQTSSCSASPPPNSGLFSYFARFASPSRIGRRIDSKTRPAHGPRSILFVEAREKKASNHVSNGGHLGEQPIPRKVPYGLAPGNMSRGVPRDAKPGGGCVEGACFNIHAGSGFRKPPVEVEGFHNGANIDLSQAGACRHH